MNVCFINIRRAKCDDDKVFLFFSFFACSLPHSIVRILFREISLWNYGIRWKLCDLCLCNKVKENFIIVFAAKNVAFVCAWMAEWVEMTRRIWILFLFPLFAIEAQSTHRRKKHGKSTYDFALIHRNLVIRKKLLFSSFRLVSCQSFLFPPPLLLPFYVALTGLKFALAFTVRWLAAWLVDNDEFNVLVKKPSAALALSPPHPASCIEFCNKFWCRLILSQEK